MAGALIRRATDRLADALFSTLLATPTDTPLDFAPVTDAIRADPKALLNPMDLVFELFRPHYFRHVRFDGPDGDPGWFGPGSAAWHVHTHGPSVLLGLQLTALVDIAHQDIRYAVYDHSKLVGRDAGGNVVLGTLSGKGTPVRAGRTLVFFMGVVLASTASAAKLCETVKGIHSKVEGSRPDGVAYDAKDPELFRFTYATVVDGIATAHAKYHPKPLRGADLDQFYLEYSKVGEALGGTNLPTTKAECDDILENHPLALGFTVTTDNVDYLAALVPQGRGPLPNFRGWLMLDIAPKPIQKMLRFRQPSRPVLFVYRSLARAVFTVVASSMGDLREIEQAKRRVSACLARTTAPFETNAGSTASTGRIPGLPVAHI